MDLVLLKCQRCGTVKEFWLRDPYYEESFLCKCGHYRAMHGYYQGGFEDYLVSKVSFATTLEEVLELARKEHIHFDNSSLREKLSSFNFGHLSELELHQVAEIMMRSDDDNRFRKELTQYKDIDSIIRAVGKLSPRIDLPKLRDYLGKIDLPLSEKDVLEMEKVIEEYFYNPEIYTVTDW